MNNITLPAALMGLMLVPFFNGCTNHLSDISMISNRDIDFNKFDIEALPQKKNIEGIDRKHLFLFIPIGQPTLSAALDNALEKANGDLMVNATVTATYSTNWLTLFGEMEIKIKGDVINTQTSNKR